MPLLRTRRLGSPNGNSGTTEINSSLINLIGGNVLSSVRNELQVLTQGLNTFGNIKANTVTATTSAVSPLVQLGTGAPLLRNNGGVIEVRDSTNAALAPFRTNALWINELAQLRSANSPSGIFISARNAANDGFVDIAAESFTVSSAITLKKISTAPYTGLRVEKADSADPIAYDIQVRSLVATDAYINGNRWSTGSSVPSSPTAGDRWLETASGVPVYGWWWTWSGSYWLSPEMYDKVSFNIATSLRHHVQIPNDFDIFVKSLQSAIFCSNTSNGYSFQLTRTNSAEAGTNIGTAISTNANAANTTVKQTSVINTHVDVSATVTFEHLLLTPAAGTGDFRGSISIVFNYARP